VWTNALAAKLAIVRYRGGDCLRLLMAMVLRNGLLTQNQLALFLRNFIISVYHVTYLYVYKYIMMYLYIW
jgi:hypothetical protein